MVESTDDSKAPLLNHSIIEGLAILGPTMKV